MRCRDAVGAHDDTLLFAAAIDVMPPENVRRLSSGNKWHNGHHRPMNATLACYFFLSSFHQSNNSHCRLLRCHIEDGGLRRTE